jgi:hypothetical protein
VIKPAMGSGGESSGFADKIVHEGFQWGRVLARSVPLRRFAWSPVSKHHPVQCGIMQGKIRKNELQEFEIAVSL